MKLVTLVYFVLTISFVGDSIKSEVSGVFIHKNVFTFLDGYFLKLNFCYWFW